MVFTELLELPLSAEICFKWGMELGGARVVRSSRVTKSLDP